MAHIFISYSRNDIVFARKIVNALVANKFNIWVDWESIPKGEQWELKIYQGIQEADAFLFLISPDSICSHMCNKEISHAVKNGKRILPIVIHDANMDNFLDGVAKQEISNRNWIFCREEQDDFAEAMEITRETIHTDFEWLDYHTQLQVKALEWERNGKEKSFLLHGKEFQDIHNLFVLSAGKAPQPTPLQRQYILTSQQAQEASQEAQVRRRNLAISALLLVSIFILGLAYFAFRQRNEARSGQLAAAAISNLDTDPERSILLAMRAIEEINAKGQALPEAVDALQQALHTSRVQHIIHIYKDKENDAQNNNFSADNWVNDVAFSPDGNFIAVARTDGKAQIWDANSPLASEPLREFSGHTGWVHTVAFSPDGALLATAGYDQEVRIWNVATGDLWKLLPEHRAVINNVMFSPDGTKLATASWDGTATIWDVANEQPLHKIRPNREKSVQVMDVAFSPKGTQLALALTDRSASLWDTDSGAVITELLDLHAAAINSIAFSPDGSKLATASDDKTVKVWTVKPGEEPLVITGHFESVRSVTFSLDGKFLFTGSIDGTVKMWDPNTGKNLITFVGHSNSVDSIAYSANHERLASASRDGTVRIWNAAIRHTSSVNSVMFSPDGQYFATASDDRTAKLWDSNSGQELRTFAESQEKQTHENRVTDVAFSPDGSRLATTGDDGTIKVWDTKTSVLLFNMNKGSDTDTVLTFNPDGTRLATADREGIIKIWDIERESTLYEWRGHTGPISGIIFTEDGTSLITSSLDKMTRIWDLESKQVIKSFSNGLMRDVLISPDGKWIVTADDDGQVRLWSVSDDLRKILIEHDNKVFDVALDSRGTRLATASWDKTSKLWFSENGSLTDGVVRWIFYSTTEVYGVAFSPDGKRLVIGTVDGQVNVYLLDVNELQEYAKTRVSRSFTEEECNQYFSGQKCPSIP